MILLTVWLVSGAARPLPRRF